MEKNVKLKSKVGKTAGEKRFQLKACVNNNDGWPVTIRLARLHAEKFNEWVVQRGWLKEFMCRGPNGKVWG